MPAASTVSASVSASTAQSEAEGAPIQRAGSCPIEEPIVRILVHLPSTGRQLPCSSLMPIGTDAHVTGSICPKAPLYGCISLILISLLGIGAALRMPVDIFPEINIPVVSVVWTYGGMSATDIQNRILFLPRTPDGLVGR